MNTHPTCVALPRRTLLGALALGLMARHAAAQAPVTVDPWPSLASQIFNGRALQDGGNDPGDRCTLSRRRCGSGPDHPAQLAPARRPTANPQYHTGDRPKPLAARRGLRPGSRQRDALPVNASAHRRLYQCACGCRAYRRATLHLLTFRQGRRRGYALRRPRSWRRTVSRWAPCASVSSHRRPKPRQDGARPNC